jgi:hypothetical protein
MNLRLPLAVLVISLALAPLSGAGLPTPAERAAKAKKYAALRLNYAASDAYHPDDDVVGDLRVQCAEQMLAKEYAKVIELAERGLRRNPYNIHLLKVQASAYRAVGDMAKADEARALWFGLMDSILDSGDGFSYGTAFRVIAIDEEDAVLQGLLLASDERRSVVRKGIQYDLLTARNIRTGDSREVYFNVDLPKKWQDRQIAKRSAPAPVAPPR